VGPPEVIGGPLSHPGVAGRLPKARAESTRDAVVARKSCGAGVSQALTSGLSHPACAPVVGSLAELLFLARWNDCGRSLRQVLRLASAYAFSDKDTAARTIKILIVISPFAGNHPSDSYSSGLGDLTSSNEGTWVLFHHDSNAAPQTLQTASPVCGTKNFSSVRLYSAPQLHRTIVAILGLCAPSRPFARPEV
jgi:hypothetical protein